MNTWTAPLIVAIISIIAAALVGEPLAAVFGIGVAVCGYLINKAENKAFMLGVKAEQERIIALLKDFDANDIFQWEVELVSLIPEITGDK